MPVLAPAVHTPGPPVTSVSPSVTTVNTPPGKVIEAESPTSGIVIGAPDHVHGPGLPAGPDILMLLTTVLATDAVSVIVTVPPGGTDGGETTTAGESAEAAVISSAAIPKNTNNNIAFFRNIYYSPSRFL